MNILFIRRFTCLLLIVSLAAGCAAPPNATDANTSSAVNTSDAGPQGRLQVVYSTRFPDGSYLKEKPLEVRLVTREATSNKVAQQIGMTVAMLALGAVAFQGFSKDNLKGRQLEGLTDRGHLKIPVETTFVTRLQTRVDTAVQASEALRARTFGRPVTVAGGSTQLVYESLLGAEEETFRLKTDLVVYKVREGSLLNRLIAPRVVECASESPEAWPQARWAEDNYRSVMTQLDAMLQACEDKVMASLETTLLAD